MNTEILGVILQWVALVVLCYPLGRYMAKVYQGRAHVARLHGSRRKVGIYKLCGINPEQEMNWKQFLKALLMVNLFWFVLGHGAALLPGLAAAQSGRQPGTDSRSGVQHLHLVHGEL